MARLSRENNSDRHKVVKKSFDWNKALLVLNIMLTIGLIYLNLR